MTTTKKIWTYNVTHSYIDIKTNVKYNAVTQLYAVGVYCIINNNSKLQLNLSPNQMQTLTRKLKKQQEKGLIKDLIFGREIKVTKGENGYYEL